MLFKVQRDSDVVDMWTVKRKDIISGGIDKNPSQASKVNAKKKISYDNTPIYINNKNNNSRIPNIVLVDDEQDILYRFKAILSNHGYNVKSFTESKEALKHIIELDYSASSNTAPSSHSHHYDLVIIDIRMPHINGIQLYQILKIINKNIKVLFISALDAAAEVMSMFPELKASSII